MIKLISCLAVLSAFSLHAAEPVVTLAGIRTIWNDAGKELGGGRIFNVGKGTTVGILISVGEGGIVALHGERSTLTLNGNPTKLLVCNT